MSATKSTPPTLFWPVGLAFLASGIGESFYQPAHFFVFPVLFFAITSRRANLIEQKIGGRRNLQRITRDAVESRWFFALRFVTTAVFLLNAYTSAKIGK
jgi:hypothetical protein